jgi:glucose-1-phosphate cytidylyltransferase
MIEVAGRPILWHIMSFYAGHGFKRFVLCLGYKADVIKRYFLDYAALESDFTVDLSKPGKLDYHGGSRADWQVTCVDTGLEAMTGARLKRVAPFLGKGNFLLTYGDGLSDVDVPKSVEFHKSHGKVATVTGVRPQSRFGELITSGQQVQRFSEKPNVEQGYINGGFFVFDTRMLDYVTDDDSCILERAPLEKVAADGQLMIYPHHGFWQCMDTLRDLQRLEEEWNGGNAPWVNWK